MKGSASRACDSAYCSQNTWWPPKPKPTAAMPAAGADTPSRRRNSQVNRADSTSVASPCASGSSPMGSTVASSVSGCSSELLMLPKNGSPPPPREVHSAPTSPR